MKVYVVEGGIGKQVAFTAMLPELAKEEKVIVLSAYPDVFYGSEYVHRAVSFKTQYAYEDLISKNDIVYFEPYWDDSFIKGKKHIIESWCDGYSIKYDKKKMLPKLEVNSDAESFGKMLKGKYGKYVMIQFTGMQSPLATDMKKPFTAMGMRKNYDFDKAQQLVAGIKSRFQGVGIVNYSMQNESPDIQGTDRYVIPFLNYAGALKYAEAFVAIDSSLQHMAAGVKKPGIVLWGATGPAQFGYDMHINMNVGCPFNTLHCMRPYLRQLGDFLSNGAQWRCPKQECMNITPDKIILELSKLIKI